MGVLLKGHPESKGPKPPKGPKAPIYQKFVDLEFPTNKNMGVLDPQMGLGKVPCWVYFSWGFEAHQKAHQLTPVAPEVVPQKEDCDISFMFFCLAEI